jgi:hypothetical protein
MDILQKMTEAIASVPFPVYGIVGEPLGLTFDGYAPHIGTVIGITLGYKSTRYPVYTLMKNPPHPLDTVTVSSEEAGRKALHVRDYFLAKIIEGQEQPVRDPFRWEGSLTIAETLFSGIITYYAAPLSIAGFRLTSEKTLITGHSCGPNVDDLVLLLEGLCVLN